MLRNWEKRKEKGRQELKLLIEKPECDESVESFKGRYSKDNVWQHIKEISECRALREISLMMGWGQIDYSRNGHKAIKSQMYHKYFVHLNPEKEEDVAKLVLLLGYYDLWEAGNNFRAPQTIQELDISVHNLASLFVDNCIRLRTYELYQLYFKLGIAPPNTVRNPKYLLTSVLFREVFKPSEINGDLWKRTCKALQDVYLTLRVRFCSENRLVRVITALNRTPMQDPGRQDIYSEEVSLRFQATRGTNPVQSRQISAETVYGLVIGPASKSNTLGEWKKRQAAYNAIETKYCFPEDLKVFINGKELQLNMVEANALGFLNLGQLLFIKVV